nr:helix-turn-helix transcriptional regulator [Acidovorax sp. 1608163]
MIARELGISPFTAGQHRKSMLKKSGAQNTRHMLFLAWESGWLALQPEANRSFMSTATCSPMAMGHSG